jgi:hypothetical protein
MSPNTSSPMHFWHFKCVKYANTPSYLKPCDGKYFLYGFQGQVKSERPSSIVQTIEKFSAHGCYVMYVQGTFCILLTDIRQETPLRRPACELYQKGPTYLPTDTTALRTYWIPVLCSNRVPW